MKITIAPSAIYGTVTARPSKSSMQRACAAALIKSGKSLIKNYGRSDDDEVALSIIQQLGARIEWSENTLSIDSSLFNSSEHIALIKDDPAIISCGESGLSTRMFVPLCALSNQKVFIKGEGSLLHRPMNFFSEVLPQLGVEIFMDNGKLPMTIQGALIPKNITIDGSVSSQFLTGLLMAYSAVSNPYEQVSIKVKDLKSKPYIDLTLDVMRHFALNVPENKNYEEFIFYKAPTSTFHNTTTYTVEGDWSGSAFLLVAGAIAGNVTVEGLRLDSAQADKRILEALQDAGVSMSIGDNFIEVRASPLKSFTFDATDCPDLFPPLVALAAYCNGVSAIQGLERLKHKESNRGITLQEEFNKMGLKTELRDDVMLIYGSGILNGAFVHSRHDHRIAMSTAVAALKANGTTTIDATQAVNKSYPDFFKHLNALNATVSVT